MTEFDFHTVAADALACIVASYGDELATDVAQSIRMRCVVRVPAISPIRPRVSPALASCPARPVPVLTIFGRTGFRGRCRRVKCRVNRSST